MSNHPAMRSRKARNRQAARSARRTAVAAADRPDPRVFDHESAPMSADLKGPRPEHPFGKTVRKCEPAGPFATSTGFNTRL